MADMEARPPALARFSRALLTEWRELGWLGRVALFGVLLSVVIAIALGFSIPASAKRHVLDAQTDIIEGLAADFAAEGIVPTDPRDTAALQRFDQEVRLRLLGGETVRVKVWAPDGTIIYSDAGELAGRRFELTKPAEAAMDGETSYEVSDLSDPAHELERDLGELIEFYVPVVDGSGNVAGAFEVEQRVDALRTTLGHIRRNVWLSIGSGLGVLTIFMASLTLAGARAVNRRRRQAEHLLGDVLRAQDAERRRIVGALHGDVGQPLYRLLYGLEGSRAKVDDPAVREELGRLLELVREVDGTLRAELKLLHRSEVEDVGLELALAELVETTQEESGLDIKLEVEHDGQIGPVPAAALFWAAEEGLINVRKHAGASHVSVRLLREGNRRVLEVVDDGVGVSRPEGIGLATTRERLDAIGGGLSVESKRGTGTRVRAWVPPAVEGTE